MKRMICILLVGLLLCCTAQAATSGAACDHRYKLFPNAFGSDYYTCLCTMGCEMLFYVYPMDWEVEQPEAEGEGCAHVFRTDEQIQRVSVEPASELSHEAAQWYNCTCEICGETFEAYVTDGHVYWHEVSAWEDIHINGQFKHLYVGHCDACGALQYDIVDCAQYEDGTCMGGYDAVGNGSPLN